MLTSPVRPTPWALRSQASDGLTVRRAGADDVVPLAVLKRRLERASYGHLASHEALSVRLHRRATAWWLLGRIAEGDLVLVALRHGELVGLGAARVDSGPGSPRVHLHSLYAEERGVLDALTGALLDAADRLGLRTVTADCFVGDLAGAQRMRRLRLAEVEPPSESPTFPGVGLSHWAGSLQTALVALDERTSP